MITRSRVAPTLLAALFLLALPAAASAETFAVNTIADEAKKAECEAGAAGCTLRGAVEAANASEADDAIYFSLTPFNGNSADTITLATPLAITDDDLLIDGTAQGPSSGQCITEALVEGPCVSVNGPIGNFGLVVEADGVTIDGLSITGALTGINVINDSDEFTATGNWIGVNLKAEAKANNTGIFLDPGSDKAEIGGSVTTQRNVIAGNNLEGLDLQGASEAKIRGNFFGVAPDGTTQMGNAVNIEITDSTSGLGAKAANNEIGGQLNAETGTTSTCDAACNVISGAASYGIDLSGTGGNEAPASGPTQIAGNHIGLAVTGVAAIANGQRGVLIGGADEVTVGGPSFEYGNHLVGGVIGILAGNTANDLDIEENSIGLDATGNPLSPPSEGINVSSEEIIPFGGEAEIIGNAINGTGTGITQHSIGAAIVGNEITNPGIGIYTYGLVGPHGNAIVENEIVSANLQGILVENDDNLIIGNEVFESGEAGIRVQRFLSLGVSGNQVGGDDPGEANLISLNGGPAIEIEDFENTNNEIARNFGSGNSGLFIDLISTEPGSEPNGPNEGTKSPAFSTATQSKAEGTAEPNATIRVFRKAGAAAGELQSFLAQTEADASGNWKVTYPSVPAGTIVAATQTNVNGGTSELSTATAAADPSSDPCKDALPAAQCAPPAGPPTTPVPPPVPDTKITKSPKAKSASTTARFKFKSVPAGSSFECKLDKGKFKKCKSPKTYKKLKPGKHVFKVRAVNSAGAKDPTPAKRKFTVLASS